MISKKNKIPDLAPYEDCVGCSACMSACPISCIKMDKDSFGFFHPLIDNKTCINCKTCESVCPVKNKKFSIIPDAITVYASYSLNDDIRKNSSSGGLFSEFAEYILLQNGVVFGAAFDTDFSVYHTSINTNSELFKFRGAKYSQSDLKNVFREVRSVLNSDKMVLFVGTPCQIAGLKLFLQKDYSMLLCIDFVCHGVASPDVWKRYVEYRTVRDNNGLLPISVNLRDKSSGWSHYKYSVHFRYSNERNYKGINGKDPFTILYSGNDIINTSCTACKYKGMNRASDITIGDFWGIWDLFPELDSKQGVSLIICNNEKGKSILKSISKKVYLKEVNLEQATADNKSFYESIKYSKYRKKVLTAIKNGKIDDAVRTYSTSVNVTSDSIIRKALIRIKQYLHN